jgi:hypothetical protein
MLRLSSRRDNKTFTVGKRSDTLGNGEAEGFAPLHAQGDLLREKIVDDMTVDVRQTVVAALETIGEPLVIKAK